MCREYESAQACQVGHGVFLCVVCRRRRWDPASAAESWHAAVMFCGIIQQLEEQGYKVRGAFSSRFSCVLVGDVPRCTGLRTAGL